MNLKELIAALIKLETIAGPDTKTQVVAVGLVMGTTVSAENEYGYTRSTTEKRKGFNLITVDVPQEVDFSASNHLPAVSEYV